MSEETITWLNQNTLVGFTDKRRHAWHYDPAKQGVESNHYPGAIPVDDVRRRLFNWQAVEGDIVATAITPDGVLTVPSKDRKAILRPDTSTLLGVHGKDYPIHQFDTWLLDELAAILDDELAIGSAGLLKGGAVAWVSIELPDTIETPEGVDFRPRLLACSSHDGSLASKYKRVVMVVVCDNTLSAGLHERGPEVNIRHTRNSQLKLASARDTLQLVHKIGEDFAAQVAKLSAIRVDEGAWTRTLKVLAPIPEKDGAGRTRAERKLLALDRLWRHDDRVAPWKDTVYGVVQAVNTYVHHEQAVKGMDRAERNMLRAVSGDIDKLDARTLERVLAVVR